MPLSRRRFLQTALAGAGATALGGTAHASGLVHITDPRSTLLGGPAPKFPNIQHVVVVMMENRSTDHFLGWWGDREDVRFDASTAHPGGRPTFDFGANGEQNWAGHPYVDPGHGHDTGRMQILDHDGDGTPDGWSVTEDGADRPDTGTDRYASSFYTDADLPVIKKILEDFTSFDRYFTSWMGSTYPNRYYMHSAQAHGIDNNDFPPQRAGEDPKWAIGFDWPTLWDFLNVRGVIWKYYFSNLPVIGLFGSRFVANARPITEYYADCAAGTLPQVAFVDPFFVAPEGLSNDDHPHADIRLGQEFYSDVVSAFLRSTAFRKGAMFINYDEWGGFWDHVTPPAVGTANDPLATYGPSVDYRQQGTWTTDETPDFGLHGFRTPAFLISPYARNTGVNAPPPGAPTKGKGKSKKAPAPEPTRDRTVSHVLDHTSILAFIAENWALPQPGQWQPGFSRTPLGTMRDAFDPSIADPDDPGRLDDIDVDAYDYTAPPEARLSALPVPASSVSELWSQADWLESLGYRINTRFADALPHTR
jgi:phospholipase C